MAEEPTSNDRNEDAPTIGANTPEGSLLNNESNEEETVVNPVGDVGDLPGDPPPDAGNQETPEDSDESEDDPSEGDDAHTDWNLKERDEFLASGDTTAPPLETLVDEDD